MAKWCVLLLIVIAVIGQTSTARDVTSKSNNGGVGLADQKNLFTFGGLGGFAGLDNNEQPVGGGGIGVGIGVGIGNANVIGGAGLGYGYGGSGAAVGGVGTFVGLGNGFAGLSAVGGGGLGEGDDGGAVTFP